MQRIYARFKISCQDFCMASHIDRKTFVNSALVANHFMQWRWFRKNANNVIYRHMTQYTWTCKICRFNMLFPISLIAMIVSDLHCVCINITNRHLGEMWWFYSSKKFSRIGFEKIPQNRHQQFWKPNANYENKLSV